MNQYKSVFSSTGLSLSGYRVLKAVLGAGLCFHLCMSPALSQDDETKMSAQTVESTASAKADDTKQNAAADKKGNIFDRKILDDYEKKKAEKAKLNPRPKPTPLQPETRERNEGEGHVKLRVENVQLQPDGITVTGELYAEGGKPDVPAGWIILGEARFVETQDKFDAEGKARATFTSALESVNKGLSFNVTEMIIEGAAAVENKPEPQTK